MIWVPSSSNSGRGTLSVSGANEKNNEVYYIYSLVAKGGKSER